MYSLIVEIRFDKERTIAVRGPDLHARLLSGMVDKPKPIVITRVEYANGEAVSAERFPLEVEGVVPDRSLELKRGYRNPSFLRVERLLLMLPCGYIQRNGAGATSSRACTKRQSPN